MDLSKFPRRKYSRITPLEKLDRLSKHLGGPNIYIKRDDLLELTGGGNKTRKLEFVIGDALKKNCDTLITCGAIQSNHCRLTLAAAVKEGLKCRLILEERVAGTYDNMAAGNNLLYHLLDPEEIVVLPCGIDETVEMQQLADKVSAAGGRPYIISGSNACGISSLGYVDCAQELIAQFTDKNLDIETIIVPSGSGGTHGGLLAGLWANGFDHINVLGINVRRNKTLQCERINEILQDINKVLGLKITIPESAVNCFDDYLGPGYSIPAAETIEAIELLARSEGILLDPVYSGKTMAGLIDLVRKNKFKKNENVLFLHSGGVPALYAYKDLFLKKAGDKRDERV